VVTVALRDEPGKPSPAVVIQSDLFNDSQSSVTVLPVTSAPVDAPLFRVPVSATPGNGLRTDSYVMVDKVQSVGRQKIGPPIGRVSDEMLVQLSRAVAVWVGIG
jgi:mRNA interferase MazF